MVCVSTNDMVCMQVLWVVLEKVCRRTRNASYSVISVYCVDRRLKSLNLSNILAT